MKHKNICKLLSGIFYFVMLLGVQSCTDMSELSDRFLDEGSIIYAAKVDSVAAHPGDGRIEMEIFIHTQRIDSIHIYWNDKTDSKSVYIGNKPGLYTVSLEMEESSYVFNIISEDKYGNKSLPVEVSSEAFGDHFRQSITGQQVRKAAYDIVDEKLTVYWGSPVNYGFVNEITYTNTDGKLITQRASIKDSSTEIADWASGLKFRTLSLPDPIAIDTFYTEFKQLDKFPIDKKTWKIDSYSSEVNDGADNRHQNAINDNYGDRWHSANNGYPEWMVIDLGAETDVRSFGVSPSIFDIGNGIVDTRFPTTVRFEVSLDKTTWTSLGEFPSVNTKAGEQIFDVTSTKARYYRFTGVESDPGVEYMTIGELDVYLY